MSGMHDGAPIDPLAALRAADHRPLGEVWRERVHHGVVAQLQRASRAIVPAVLLALLLVAIGWRMFVTTQPPVEDSLPLASARSTPTAVVEQTAPSEPTSSVVGPSAVGPTDATTVVVVHVAGAVRRPGLVSGDAGWRVDDAVSAAGGAIGSADLDRLNLAAPVLDGQRIYVPHEGEDEPTVLNPTSGSTSPVAPGPVNLNTADAATLETLPGVGPATAAVIVAHREDHGNFGSVDALVAVRGIGPATLESLRQHVTV